MDDEKFRPLQTAPGEIASTLAPADVLINTISPAIP
jgi:hypothetical protein